MGRVLIAYDLLDTPGAITLVMGLRMPGKERSGGGRADFEAYDWKRITYCGECMRG